MTDELVRIWKTSFVAQSVVLYGDRLLSDLEVDKKEILQDNVLENFLLQSVDQNSSYVDPRAAICWPAD
jgi:hypothetical protein